MSTKYVSPSKIDISNDMESLAFLKSTEQSNNKTPLGIPIKSNYIVRKFINNRSKEQ